ncbi:XRE family transcriptional regulator [Fructilactobacillus ixorae]|uniref:XRE family transcriptional regulator n=1 Tax=Fructilactobacillus ixorae TaxID=1750535 RepID=A0ABY5C5G8_9LACO|nr:XRE family transcriptional regulator [Fructilactobacillus ixorae]USS93632.1 XRE family transcriptional regulator [Fructilactobacillus ixorae]
MKFNGLRLRDIRESFNMSRIDLANILDISEQDIWKIETGISTPSFQILSKLNREFGVTLSFFTSNLSIPKVSDSKYIAYRSDLKRSIRNTDRETTYVSLIDNYIDEMLKNVSIPEETVSRLSEQIIKKKDNGYDFDDISIYIRKFFNLGDRNNRLMAMIEKSGVFIIERNIDINNKVDAYSTWTDNSRPYIVLGTNKSASRRQFDLAHEFGHILLHHNLEFDYYNSSSVIHLENEANSFASSLLLEKNSFIDKFKSNITDPTEPNQYLYLKKYYNVSIAALEMRAFNLKLMTPKQAGYFWGKMNKRGYKKYEPLDDALPMYIPGKLYAILNSFNKKELHDFYDNTGTTRKFIDKLIIRKIDHSNNKNIGLL